MKLKRPHFEKLKSLTKKQKKLILAGIALLMLILAACYTVFIAPLLQKEQWIYKEETVERGTLKVGVTESGSLEYNTKSVDYDLDLDVSDDDEDDSDEDDDCLLYTSPSPRDRTKISEDRGDLRRQRAACHRRRGTAEIHGRQRGGSSGIVAECGSGGAGRLCGGREYL